MLVLGSSSEISLITTTLTPAWTVGTVGFYQSGVWGTPKGLLLALTNSPTYTQMLMTDHGLRNFHHG